jgi:asparagine synthase (glutamine-hydrolysing)
MQGLNLAYTDRASMAASVEVRVPYIDKEVVEFAMSLEGSLKIKNRVTKYILKRVGEDYIPKEIAYRPKASFGMPIRAWISFELKEMVESLLSKDSLKKRGFINYEFVKEIIDNDKKGLEDNAYRIYQLITLELWLRRYVDR